MGKILGTGDTDILASKAIINIQEGFKIGATIETVNLGDFEVDAFNNGGAMRQTLQLNASWKPSRLNNNNSYFIRNYQNGEVFFTDFNDVNDFATDWISYGSNSVIGVSGGYLGLSISPSAAENQIIYNRKQTLENFEATIKWRQGISVAQFGMGFLFRGQNLNSSTFGGYLVDFDQSNTIIYGATNGSYTNLVSTTPGHTWGKDYWTKIQVYGDKIAIFESTDGLAYTRTIGMSGIQIPLGGIAIRQASTGVAQIDSFDLVELEKLNYNEDIISKSFALAGVYGLTYENNYEGMSGWLSSSGSSFVLGGSNYVYLNLAGTGNSWHTFQTPYSNLNDFIATFDMRAGSSDLFVGAFVGATLNWTGIYMMSSAAGASHRNREVSIENIMGGSRYSSYAVPNINFGMVQNKWYKCRFVKNGLFLGFYVNDTLIKHTYGISLPNSGNSVSFGFFAYRNFAGSTMEWKNFRISKLDQIVDSIQLQPNETTASLLQRAFPSGFALNQFQNGLQVFEIGTSRGSWNYAGINSSGVSSLISSEESFNNTAGEDFTIGRGKGGILSSRTTQNNRKLFQVDSGYMRFYKDESIVNITDLQKVSQVLMTLDNKDFYDYNAAIRANPLLEQYDLVKIMDEKTNSSLFSTAINFVLYNFNKSFDFSTGMFQSTLELGYGLTGI